jgi:16S rRNA (adenine1518-N6/adenine1519-N6)-dimethyltransferase
MKSANISDIKAAMVRRGIHPRKMWGQNFLKERGIHELIVREGEVTEGDVVLEIGSGPGGLTSALSAAGARVLAVEVDRGLIAVARELIGTPEGVVWINADALAGKNRLNPEIVERLSGAVASSRSTAFKLIANLPYNISVPLIVNLLEAETPCALMVVMVQDEVADRLLASPGTSEYGVAGAVVSSLAAVRRVRRVGAAAFWPKPGVSSSVIKIVPLPEPFPGEQEFSDFKTVARGVFAQRRKGWLKSLLSFLGADGKGPWKEKFRSAGFEIQRRAETLSVAEIAEIAGAVRDYGLLGTEGSAFGGESFEKS